jgi:hypothetical protein
MMLYIEHANGTSVSGAMAAEIRDFARSVWRGFYVRGMAPEKWGDASRQVRDEYIREMENEWTVLRLCENHWKANAIATSIYSQWYHSYDKKMKGIKEEDGNRDEPATKKRRTTAEATDDARTPPPDPQANREATSTPETPEVENIQVAVAMSSQLQQQGASVVTSKPKARPLRNPL